MIHALILTAALLHGPVTGIDWEITPTDETFGTDNTQCSPDPLVQSWIVVPAECGVPPECGKEQMTRVIKALAANEREIKRLRGVCLILLIQAVISTLVVTAARE